MVRMNKLKTKNLYFNNINKKELECLININLLKMIFNKVKFNYKKMKINC